MGTKIQTKLSRMIRNLGYAIHYDVTHKRDAEIVLAKIADMRKLADELEAKVKGGKS